MMKKLFNRFFESTRVEGYRIWILGDGRSGTTFLAEMVNNDNQYEIFFEPFHPILNKNFKFLKLNQYVAADKENKKLEQRAKNIFDGKFINKRRGLIYSKNNNDIRQLIVKDIFANLFAYWLVKKNSTIKPIFIIRNPFAVAYSKYVRKDWDWMTDPRDFLKQRNLVNDFLKPFEGLILNIGEDFIERQILIWAILNYVPLVQFKNSECLFIFYEDLLYDQFYSFAKIFEFIGEDFSIERVNKCISNISKPSLTSDTDEKTVNIDNVLTKWQLEISDEQIKKGKEILTAFGLDTLYDSNYKPNREELDRLFS